MKKGISYVFMILGVLILASSIAPIKSLFIVYFPFLESIDNLILIVVGAVVLVLGVLLIRGGKALGKALAEVPIFEGNKVVGYRRQ